MYGVDYYPYINYNTKCRELLAGGSFIQSNAEGPVLSIAEGFVPGGN
jgi:hypothetical protein